MFDRDPTPPQPTRAQLETELEEREAELATALERVAELEDARNPPPLEVECPHCFEWGQPTGWRAPEVANG